LAVIVLLGLVAALLFPTSAAALTSSGHGVGYLWKGDGVSWLGTYRLADGRLAFCLEAGKTSPVGNDYVVSDSSTTLGLSKADIGRLAYIARKWASTSDPTTAAAAQLAVWSITGLNGHSRSYYAGRANDARDAVLARSDAMLAEAASNATVSAASSVSIRLDPDGTGYVRADLTTTLASGAAGYVAPSSRSAALTLTGAAFDDGSTTKGVTNAEYTRFRATGQGVTVTVRATAVFNDLPFAASVTVGSSAAGSQMLLFTPAGTTSSTASASQTEISPLPFRPRVQTRTSQTEAKAGARITDSLRLDAAPGDGLLSDWGVFGDSASSTLPIPITVRSTLLGPFSATPKPSADWPTDPPTVCTVAVVATTGPGDYRTPACTLPSDGYYVWVETVDPSDTATDRGGDRVKPWRSPFAQATEVTHVTADARVPSIRTTAAVPAGGPGSFTPGDCVADSLHVAGLGSDGSAPGAEVESLLLGPFDEAPAEGRDFGLDDPGSLPIAGRATTEVNRDGDFVTSCVEVSKPGHYVFVLRSEGSPEGAGAAGISAFADLVAHTAETVAVTPPATPVVPEKPSKPEVPHKPEVPKKPVPPQPAKAATPKALAYTGSEDLTPEALAAVGALSVGLAAIVGTMIARVVKRRRVRASRSERP
jgi:hypothetical protein